MDHAQLRGLGFSEGAIAHGRGKRFHRIHRGVYAVGRPDISQRGRWTAALLASGSAAALSHETAGAAWGICEDDPGGVHVSLPAATHPQHAGIRVHRRTPMPPVVTVDGLRLVEPLYVLVDLALRRSFGRVQAMVNEADKLGLIRVDEAVDRIVELEGRPGIRKLRAVLTAHRVTDSGLERRFLRVCATAGLPQPLTQAEVVGFRVDFYWPQLRLVVETDGLTYHRTPAQQAKDRFRDQRLTAAGLTCLRFTNAQVRRQEGQVATTLAVVARRLQSTDDLSLS